MKSCNTTKFYIIRNIDTNVQYQGRWDEYEDALSFLVTRDEFGNRNDWYIDTEEVYASFI